MSQTMTKEALLSQLESLAKEKKIRVLDYQFARFIAQFDDELLVVLAAAVASYHSGQGHVCVYLNSSDLSALFDLTTQDINKFIRPLLQALNVDRNRWHISLKEALANSHSVGSNAPLMLDDDRLYLQRYWHFEQQISQFLIQRSQQQNYQVIGKLLKSLFHVDIDFCWRQLQQLKTQGLSLGSFCSDYFHLRQDIGVDEEALNQYLAHVDDIDELAQLYRQFSHNQCIDWQQVAVAQASANQFSVISGGPGTGKTTTVTKLLALLVQQAHERNQVLNIELVAPTGKAAARLTESISGAVNKLNIDDELKVLIPTQASTIHRLLGVIANRVEFKHNETNPLHLDVLIVDEASMIDISLMAKLFAAIAPQTKLIMLGDKDQLSSVEAGAVFADICQGLAQGPNYSEQAKAWLSEQTGFVLNEVGLNHQDKTKVDDSLSLLQKSYRFNEKSGIGALAKAVNEADINSLKAVWQREFQDISLHNGANNQGAVVAMTVMGYRDYLANAHQLSTQHDMTEEHIADLLAQFNEFQLLTPTRDGALGVNQLNQKIEQQLLKHQLISREQGTWYVGRPVMVVSNDHSQQLFNGDIGIVMPPVSDNGHLPQNRVYFKMADGSIQSFLPSRLPAHETVYAMTIHKSQGSEFDDVVMALPDNWTPLLTKELLYTGITRAKKSVNIFADVGILQKSALTQTKRYSGLSHLLTGS